MALFKGKSPTVQAVENFDPKRDSAELREAVKGLGTDEKTLIKVISKRSNAQRQKIVEEYKPLYGKHPIDEIKDDTSGNLEILLVALMTPIDEYYASEVNYAITGPGTTESTLIEVLCALKTNELQAVKAAYQKLYNVTMESDLIGETSGHFRRLLVSLCTANRSEGTTVDNDAAEADARALLAAGELLIGTDESTFNTILCTKSFKHLKATFKEYKKISGISIKKTIEREFSGDIKDGHLAIVQCVSKKASYFARRLHHAMSGAGTSDRTLIRIIATRSEIDLGKIKEVYKKKYGKSLESAIKDDTSGDYRKLLTALL